VLQVSGNVTFGLGRPGWNDDGVARREVGWRLEQWQGQPDLGCWFGSALLGYDRGCKGRSELADAPMGGRGLKGETVQAGMRRAAGQCCLAVLHAPWALGNRERGLGRRVTDSRRSQWCCPKQGAFITGVKGSARLKMRGSRGGGQTRSMGKEVSRSACCGLGGSIARLDCHQREKQRQFGSGYWRPCRGDCRRGARFAAWPEGNRQE
jgi:hypothetical protein